MSGEKKAKGWRFYGLVGFGRNSTAFRWRLGVAICWQWARKNVVAAGGAQQSANRSQ
ncbi:hypothetical protein GCM10029976_002990 [Kribbella albertanoniae]